MRIGENDVEKHSQLAHTQRGSKSKACYMFHHRAPLCVCTQQSLLRSGIEENLCVSAWRVVLISRWPLDLLTSNIKYIYILCWTEENKKKKRKFSVRYPFTTGDMTGAYSVHTIYEGHEIMFHVSTLLPYSKDNKQQVRIHIRGRAAKSISAPCFGRDVIAYSSCFSVGKEKAHWQRHRQHRLPRRHARRDGRLLSQLHQISIHT